MEHRKIGSLSTSLVGLGCNNFGGRIDYDATVAVLDAALDCGVTFFDTADIYGGTKSEEFMGRALKGRRDQFVLATKFGMKVAEGKEGARPEYIRQALEDSLARLQVDTIDLYQLHRPDDSVPIADTLGELNRQVEAGKIREIGCSNFSSAQIKEAEAAAAGGARFVSVQNYYSLLHPEEDPAVLPLCEELGLGYLPFFPLASGLLSGKYGIGKPHPEGTRIKSDSDALSERNLQLVDKLDGYAQSQGHTLLELAIGWLASQPAIASVISGATKPEQVRANAKAADWKLTPTQMSEVAKLLI